MSESIDICNENVVKYLDISIEDNIIQQWYNNLDVLEDTKQTYLTHLKEYLKWLRNNNIVNATKGDILKYKQYLISNYSNATV